ncbi:hypothetical protein KVV02_001756 [Mortierella alpina]|uniref:FAD-binding domain-containing protein n=1 Tax=Mortierella alpina TaxID=64518 RepID=A0A9P7ZZ64_MORAP|nr:hypothetical protein KVV02_001756 [Mortierella alpina]
MMASVSARNFKAKVMRLSIKNMPARLNKQVQMRSAANWPQVSFLPLIKDNGSVKPAAQPSLQKPRKEPLDVDLVPDAPAVHVLTSLISYSHLFSCTMPAEHKATSFEKRPRVLIVGAGLGGLTLGLLLERAGVPYDIFERAAVVKPLGSAISLTANTAPLFRQLGIYDEFTEAGLVYNKVMMHDENMNLEHVMDFSPTPDM